MFKAIKNNKIIAINETGDFPLMDHDSIGEDTEHTVSDYMQVNDEFVLTSSAEAIEQRKEEARAERDRRIDAIRWRVERYQTQLAIGVETSDTETKYKKILKYIQALRDIPLQENFPEYIEWPKEPK